MNFKEDFFRYEARELGLVSSARPTLEPSSSTVKEGKKAYGQPLMIATNKPTKRNRSNTAR